MQDLRDVVDRRGVDGRDHGLLVDVAHQRDLALDVVGDVPVGPADDRVGLDADRAQRGDRVLGGLGLQLTGRPDVGHQGDVQEEAVVAADVVADLAGGLEERQRLDVADGAADLGDHHVDVAGVVRLAHRADPVLDLVGDVRDHLDGVAEVVAAALLGDHRGVDLAGRHVGDAGQVGVEEPLVVPDVEVGLRPVVGHEDLAVLERVHRPGVDVEVRVELLHRDPQAAGLEQAAEGGGRQPLAERRGDAAGDEHVLGGLAQRPRGTPVEIRCAARMLARPRGSRLATTRRGSGNPRRSRDRQPFGLGAGHGAVAAPRGAVVPRLPGRLLARARARRPRPRRSAPRRRRWTPRRRWWGRPRTRADQPVLGRGGHRAGQHDAVAARRRAPTRSVDTMLPAPSRSSARAVGLPRDHEHQAAPRVDVAVDREQLGGGEPGQRCSPPPRRASSPAVLSRHQRVRQQQRHLLVAAGVGGHVDVLLGGVAPSGVASSADQLPVADVEQLLARRPPAR